MVLATDTLNEVNAKDTVFIYQTKVFFRDKPSPLFRKFNQDSLFLARANSEIDNLATSAIPLKQIAAGKSIRKSAPSYRKSHFSGHLLKPVHHQPVIRSNHHENWQSLLLLGILFSIACVRVLYPKRFTMLWNAFRLRRFANQLFREENVLTQRISILLFGIFLVSGAYFFYHLNETGSYISAEGILGKNYSGMLMLFSGFILFKFLIHSIFGVVFKTQKEMAEYLFNMSLIQQMGGISLFVLMAVQILGNRIPNEMIVLSGTAIFLGIFVFQTYRGLVSALGGVSPVYFFLYFCALEILPLIWIIKLVIG